MENYKPKCPPIARISNLQWYRYELRDEPRVASLGEERNEVNMLLQIADTSDRWTFGLQVIPSTIEREITRQLQEQFKFPLQKERKYAYFPYKGEI